MSSALDMIARCAARQQDHIVAKRPAEVIREQAYFAAFLARQLDRLTTDSKGDIVIPSVHRDALSAALTAIAAEIDRAVNRLGEE